MINKRQGALEAILAERKRQLEVEGMTPAGDDKLEGAELSGAARCYFEATAIGDEGSLPVPTIWPFDDEAWKPKDRRRNLVRAGALLIAERERLIRKADRALEADAREPVAKLDLSPVQKGLCVVLAALQELDARELAAERGDVSTRAPDVDPVEPGRVTPEGGK